MKPLVEDSQIIKDNLPSQPDSCLQDSYFRKYRQITKQKHDLQQGKIFHLQQHQKNAQKAVYLMYEKWKEIYERLRLQESKDAFQQSLKILFKQQFRVASIAYYLQIILHLSLTVVIYFIFANISKNTYETRQNLILILIVIAISMMRPALTQFSNSKLHSMGIDMYKLVSYALISKSLKCSILSNKKITIGQLIQLMHIQCQKLLNYPSTRVAIVEGVLYIALISAFIVYLGKLAGFIGVIFFILILSLRFFFKKIFDRIEKQLSQQTAKRIKAQIQVFSIIKFIKVNCLQSCYFNKLKQARMAEVQKIRSKILTLPFLAGISIILKQISLVIIMKLIIIFSGSFVLSTAFAINLAFTLLNVVSLLKSINEYSQIKLGFIKIEDFLNTQEMDLKYLTYLNGTSDYMIQIKDGNFFWEEQQKPIETKQKKKPRFMLKQINLQIMKGQLVAVIGSYASGKSSLANCLLGQMKSEPSSKITINGSIAYCCQTPWILNDTVKKNILLGKPYIKSKYHQVLKYSCLYDDLSIFAQGDKTMIGQKGSTISGGQKARIALARAIYSDADIMILDDILSAVDAHVGAFLFNETIKKYLRSKTVLLITHSLYYVKHTDKILLLENGAIKQGKFQQLQHLEIFRKVVSQDLANQEYNAPKQLPNKNVEALSFQQSEDTESQVSGGTQNQISFSSILQIFVKRNQGCLFVLITILFIFLVALLLMFFRIYLNAWSNSSAQGQNHFIILLIGLNVIIVFVIFLNSFVLYISPMFQSLHDDIIKSLLFAPLSYFESVPFDKIVSGFSNELNNIDKIFTNEFIQAEVFSQIMFSYFFGALFVFAYFHYYMVIFYVIVHFGSMVYLYQARLYLDLVSNRLQQSLMIPIKSKCSQILNGLSSLRAYRKAQSMLSVIVQKANVFGYASQLRSSIQIRIKLIVTTATSLLNIGILLLVYFNGNGMGTLFIFLLYNTFGLEDSVLRAHSSIYELISKLKAFERCEQLTRIEPEQGFKKYLTNNYVQNEEFKQYFFSRQIFQRGEVRLVNYSLRYKPELEDVLKNINVVIRTGEKIGIVGRTGSGKSSLMLGLLRMLQASAGKIYIDGIDTSTLSLEQLRSNINIILQEHFLFTGTIRDNVDPTRSFSDQQVIKALTLCGIWKSFENKEGLDSVIEQGGSNLSSGEKQLINISRSLLNKKRIVLIDEATANIDLQTDKKIQKVIREQFRDKTVLTIVHRINTVLDSDRILVLSKGQVAEFGPPAQLLRNSDSLFFKLHQEAGKKKE